ncbi:MAG: oligosaccharide flippase family protein [Bacteroidales bacterium]|nr:oligosaccharide flippase family protein [Bacteroidales bacterium]
MTKKEIFSSEFLRNILTLISGTAIAQLIPVAMQLILRRIYTPEVFGAFAVYMSLVGILVVVSTLRYEMAIVLPEKDKDATNIVGLSIFISVSINVIFFLILLIFKEQIIKLLDFPVEYSYWLYLIPLSTLLLSTYQALNYWLIRKKAFKASSINKISRRSAEGIIQASMGFLKKPLGLALGDIIGNLANNISGLIQLKKNDFKFSNINFVTIKYVAKRYIEFPKYQAFPYLLNTISLLFPVLIINRIYSEDITGYFDLSRMVLALPLSLITMSISQVLFQKISEKRNKGEKILKDILNTSKTLALLTIPAIIILYFWGTELFGFVFGKTWEISGDYTSILVFSYSIKFIVSPISIVFPALEKIKIGAIWQIFYFCTIIILVFLPEIAIKDFLFIYVGIELIAYAIYFFMIYKVTQNYDKSLN